LHGGPAEVPEEVVESDSLYYHDTTGEAFTPRKQTVLCRRPAQIEGTVSRTIRDGLAQGCDVAKSVKASILEQKTIVLRLRLEGDDTTLIADQFGRNEGKVSHVGTNIDNHHARPKELVEEADDPYVVSPVHHLAISCITVRLEQDPVNLNDIGRTAKFNNGKE
jgi:hypothetical protein